MHWTRGQLIGRGSTATVSIATVGQSGEVFAVKSAEFSQSEFLQKEQTILSTLRCPQIIACKGFDVTQENGKLLYNIFLEYAPGGTLLDAIRNHGGCLDESIIRSYTKQILLGLHYLHSNGIVHGDIKCHNILVTSDGPKIADLGCAKRVDQISTPIAGTPVYMAPEVARGEHQGFPADVWALGCTVVRMATGKAPWADITNPVSALYQIGFSSNLPEIPSSMSKEGKDFLSKCLKRDPMERWSASELLKHDFITEEGCSVLKNKNVDTPTSVLEQHGLWDSTWNPTHTSSCHSPTERIQKLAQNNEIVPEWEWDQTWVRVRSKDGSEECEFVYANEAMSNSFSLGTVRVSGENNLINFIPAHEATNIGGLITSNTSNCTITISYKIFINDYLCDISNSFSKQEPAFVCASSQFPHDFKFLGQR